MTIPPWFSFINDPFGFLQRAHWGHPGTLNCKLCWIQIFPCTAFWPFYAVPKYKKFKMIRIRCFLYKKDPLQSALYLILNMTAENCHIGCSSLPMNSDSGFQVEQWGKVVCYKYYWQKVRHILWFHMNDILWKSASFPTNSACCALATRKNLLPHGNGLGFMTALLISSHLQTTAAFHLLNTTPMSCFGLKQLSFRCQM